MLLPEVDHQTQDVFTAKILLLGEYTLITGSKALALPLPHYSASFHHAETPCAVRADSRLDQLCHYLSGSKILSESMDLKRLEQDIQHGIYLDSNIPRGYGIGSSGALCAALYARYAPDFERKTHYDANALNHLKDIMALMENFYHGTSSGLDCLISLVNSPVLIHERNQCEVISTPDLGRLGHFYLYDSGAARGSSNLVPQFVHRHGFEVNYKNKINQMQEIVDKMIDQIITPTGQAEFHQHFHALSVAQYDVFADMIPDAVKPLWQKGLETGQKLFKLCGAGGGGFFLVYSPDAMMPPHQSYTNILG